MIRNTPPSFYKTSALIIIAVALSACGGSGGSSANNSDDSEAKYAIGGSVRGLAGTGLVLQNIGSDDLAIGTEGSFSFAEVLREGSDYAVTVLNQPEGPSQLCTVTNGSGVVKVGGITSIVIDCLNSYTVGGTVTGLTGAGLVLQNNGGDDLTISSDGSFSFATELGNLSDFVVAVLNQPESPDQYCTVVNGEGTIGNESITSIGINCVLSGFLTQVGAVTIADLGGSSAGDDRCQAVTVDALGNSYCAGYTAGSLGEASGGLNDAFIAKFNLQGRLQWITQLGAATVAGDGDNAGDDRCHDVVVDSMGDVYCAGETSGALGEANGGIVDAFIMKLDSAGDLQWVTQLGTSTLVSPSYNQGRDLCSGIAVDADDNVYCAGRTDGALGSANAGGYDGFIMKLNSAGTLQWVSQYGTSKSEVWNGIGIDSDNNIYCGGESDWFSGRDVFIKKFNSAGIEIPGAALYYISDIQDAFCYAFSVDSAGNSYCAGANSGSIGESNAGGSDAFVMKLDSDIKVQWVTQLGARHAVAANDFTGNDYCWSVSADSVGNSYCVGYSDGVQGEASGGGYDAFIMKLDSEGDLQWLTQLGAATRTASGDNSGHDYCLGAAVSPDGGVYCGGYTTGNLDETSGGGEDMFVLRLDSNGELEPNE